MKNETMTSLERVFTSMQFKEPDRVPLFLFLTITGAKELGLSIKEYYSSADNVVQGQLLMRKKYNNDLVTNFLYSAAEIEAWGGEVIFCDDGPPNSGEPFIKEYDDILKLDTPEIKDVPCLLRELDIIRKLKAETAGEVPIIGAVTSPFSLPIMQMGFEKYLELIYNRKDLFDKLMKINEDFCSSWANAQLEAGATIISYADPLASPTIIEKETYLKTGFEVSKRTIARIKGATSTNLASGIAMPVINDLVETGTNAVLISKKDDIATAKKIADKRLVILGNFSALEIMNWDSHKINHEIKNIITKAAPGGGFILSDNHGEIPWQTPEHVLFEIVEAVQEHGIYNSQGDK